MKKFLIFSLLLGLIYSKAAFSACTYTGKAENVSATDRGITFTVVVHDCSNVEVLRRNQIVSTGTILPSVAVDSVKNVVEKMTMEMWAHAEGAKEALMNKDDLENFSVSVDHFIPLGERPDPDKSRV